MKKKTVRDFSKFLKEVYPELSDNLNVRKSLIAPRAHFLDKLNNIGARNFKSIRPEDCKDIDATVELSDEEWDDLESEAREIIRISFL